MCQQFALVTHIHTYTLVSLFINVPFCRQRGMQLSNGTLWSRLSSSSHKCPIRGMSGNIAGCFIIGRALVYRNACAILARCACAMSCRNANHYLCARNGTSTGLKIRLVWRCAVKTHYYFKVQEHWLCMCVIGYSTPCHVVYISQSVTFQASLYRPPRNLHTRTRPPVWST